MNNSNTVSTSGNLSTINCTFINNTSPIFIYIGGNNFTIINFTFTNNTIGQHRGAIFNPNGKNFVISNSTFINNFSMAGSTSGTIFNNVLTSIKIINSRFINNSGNNLGDSAYNGGNDTIEVFCFLSMVPLLVI